MPLTVLNTGSYIFAQSNTGESSGLIGQVTKLDLDGVIFYTRETTRGVDSFSISSGERWGDKIGKKPRASRQALDLWAPPEHWDKIAAFVTEHDHMHRAVLKNKNFTPDWAEKHFFNEVE